MSLGYEVLVKVKLSSIKISCTCNVRTKNGPTRAKNPGFPTMTNPDTIAGFYMNNQTRLINPMKDAFTFFLFLKKRFPLTFFHGSPNKALKSSHVSSSS